jgi:ABC-type branched-subunit amino acid transport system ATPase component
MLLELEKLEAGYGPSIIVHGVDLTVAQGEIVCIIGPNGAGKSTVLRAVAGQITPVGGKVCFDGQDITGLDIRQKAEQGLIFIPQGKNIFPNLSVVDNLEIAASIIKDRKAVDNAVERVIEKFSAIRPLKDRPARELSGGQRQLLALSRILLLRPRLVLLDEPSLGLSPMVVDQIFEEIQRMNQEGISFLLVEQNARKGLAVSHRGYVLELGRNRLSGPGQALLDNPKVRKLYLGG